MRKQPPQKASNLQPGTRRRGLDGAMYVVTDRKRWALANPDGKLPEIAVRLRPKLYDIDKERYIKDPSFDFEADRAREIVQSAVVAAGEVVHRVKKVQWKYPCYKVKVIVYNPEAAAEEIRSVIEDYPEDSWMEGDIGVTDNIELHLRICKKKAKGP